MKTAWLFLAASLTAFGATSETNQFLQFVRAQAAALRAADPMPATEMAWQHRRTALRANLANAWGEFPARTAPPAVRKMGQLERDGYRVEKLLIETFPGVWMTANAYVPERAGRVPALLMVHGHWRGAKQDPVVQARCLGAAKLGFFVLVVDAFGAGERGMGKALGEYHGEMTAATLLPVGMPLSGIQVFENMRAVDYLQTREEVDPSRLGISGASGGGNQSMYAGAWDERFSAVAPVCSVGNYQAYLGAACCMCEVVPGALRFTEESGVLGLAAPRALLVINATRDARQFSVEEARISLAAAGPIFQALGKPAHLRHSVFESGHDYSQPMRETVYGWMALHLKNEGDGSPIAEPAITPENPEDLRCFPGDSRPDDWMTIPKFAAARARELQERRKAAGRPEKSRLLRILENELLGGFPPKEGLQLSVAVQGEDRQITFAPERGITLTARQTAYAKEKVVVLIDLEGAEHAATNAIPQREETSVITLDLRATGKLAWPSDKIGRAPDHTTAQWSLWIGRPLLGQWVWDLRRFLDALQETDGKLPASIELIGVGPGGVVAFATAALDERITRVTTVGTLTSFITEQPYENQRLGIIVPGILQKFGDVSEFAAVIARH